MRKQNQARGFITDFKGIYCLSIACDFDGNPDELTSFRVIESW